MAVRSTKSIKTSVEPCYNVNTGEHDTNFKISKFFINSSHQTITAVLRNNLPVTMMHVEGSYAENRLIIRTVYEFKGRERIVRTLNDIKSGKDHSITEEELDVLSKAIILSQQTNPTLQTCRVVLDRVITVLEIDDGAPYYVIDQDILVYKGAYNPSLPHPYSDEGQAIKDYHQTVTNKTLSGWLVEVVDNEKTIDDRYLYVGNDLMRLPPIKDPTKRSGIYKTTIKQSDQGEPVVQTQRVDLQDSESVGIYKTQEAAMTKGQPDLKHKADNQERELLLNQLKTELEEYRTKSKIDELNRTREINELKHKQDVELTEIKARYLEADSRLQHARRELEELKAELDRQRIKREQERLERETEHAEYEEMMRRRRREREAKFEEEAFNRKNTNEWIKFIPALLTGIFAVATFFIKQRAT